MFKTIPKGLFFIIPIVSLIMHWSIFNKDLIGIHLWRQSQTQINIQHFYRTDFNILNPRQNGFNSGDNIKRYEFPIMQWLIAGGHKLFGESITITRISLFIIGILSAYGFFCFIYNLFNDTLIAFLSAWAYNFSPLFYYYTLNPLPDLMALCSSIWAFTFFTKYLKTHRRNDILLSAFCMLVASLAKLPFIVLGTGIGLYFLIRIFKETPKTHPLSIATIFLLFQIPALIWYAWVIPTWQGNGVLTGIFENQVTISKYLSILKFHIKELLPHILLGYGSIIFFLASFFFILKQKVYKKSLFWAFAVSGLMVIFYFLLELNMIDTVHDYYMMPFLLPLFTLVAYSIKNMWQGSTKLRGITALILFSLPLFAYKAVNNYWSIEKSFYNRDALIHREILRKAVPQNALCIIVNDESTYVFSYLIDKQGYIFWNDHLPTEWVADMVQNKNATYMYSDSRKVDENPDIQKYFDSKVLETGSIRVFKLKKYN